MKVRNSILTTCSIAIYVISACTSHVNAQLSGISIVRAGGSNSCSLSTSGGVQCWGSNAVGQLGDGTNDSHASPVDVTGLTSGVIALSTGENHSCVITSSGGAKCWGANNYGQLGDGTTNDRTAAVDVSGLTSGVSQIVGGSYHTCAVTTAGAAICWGNNGYGRVGDGTQTQRLTPTAVTGLESGVATVGAGNFHSCAVTTSGAAKCWGYGSWGQIGDGASVTRLTPANVSGLGSGVASIDPGYDFTCAVTTAGGAKCWGNGVFGNLGDNSVSVRSTPVNVSGLSSGVSAIQAGAYHTCASLQTGGVKCWGYNMWAQLGDLSTTQRRTPVNVVGLSSGVTSIVAGSYHNCAVNVGNVYCWGMNSSGQLGDGSYADSNAPLSVAGLNSGILTISSGDGHTCALGTDGGLKCWGSNTYGELGDGSTAQSATPKQVSGLTSGIIAVSSGWSHSFALTEAGGVKCWGENLYGQLGDGTGVQRLTPVDVSGLTSGISAIAAGYYFTCVLTSAGGVKCWGANNYGQFGDGTTTSTLIPTDIPQLASGIAHISVGSNHACAVTVGGAGKCWGNNGFGQLGDGTIIQRTSPIDIAGLSSGVDTIVAGLNYTCALSTAGGLKCWGKNSDGQLGDGSTTQSLTPIDVVGLTSGVKRVSVSQGIGAFTCAIDAVGALKCWGGNVYGNLGDYTHTTRLTPNQVYGLTSGVAEISNGSVHSCAILSSTRGMKCWGYNNVGQLGVSLAVHTVLRSMHSTGSITLTGSPLAGVTLATTNLGDRYLDRTVTTDASGNYQLGIEETLPFTITPYLEGYAFAPPSITGTMSSDFVQNFVATLITYNITGTVTVGGNPLQGATVDGGVLGTVTTNASGAYAFNAIAHGTVYTLTVSHGGATFGIDTANGTLSSNATHDFSGTLNTYNITGTITAGGSPLSGVSVSGGGLGNTATDGSGAYSFASVNYGTVYTITPSLGDYDFSPVSAGGTLAGNAAHDFTGVYSPPTTTSTSSIPTTSLASTTTVTVSTTAPLPTTAPTTSISTTVPSITTTTSALLTTSFNTTSSVDPLTTTLQSTSTVVNSSTTLLQDSDNDGVTDYIEATLGTNPNDADTDDDGVTDGDEIQIGTNPKDPGSKKPKLRTTICSEWNGYLGGASGNGMYNIMEHVNLTTKKVRVKTELRSIRGHLTDTYEFFLRGNQQFDLLVHDMSGRELNSYGQVCTTYERAPAGSLDGRMVYYKFGSGDIQFAFALPFENPSVGTSALPYNTYQPSLDPQDLGNLVANWVQLSNVSKKRLKGQILFHRLDGSRVGKPLAVNLRDGARYDYSAHDYGANNAGLIRFVPNDKTVEYQLRAVRYVYDNQGSKDSFDTAYPFNSLAGSGEALIAPVDTTESSAILELSNTLSKKVSVRLKLYDKTGVKLLYNKTHSLKAYSTLHLPLNSLLTSRQGVLIAKGSHVGGIIGTVVHYGFEASGGVRNMYAIELREPIGAALKGSYNTYLDQGCTLYLANVASAKEKVRISMKKSDGTNPVGDYSLTVPAHGALAEDICSKAGKNNYGVVSVTANVPNHIYGVVLRKGAEGRYKMGTVLR